MANQSEDFFLDLRNLSRRPGEMAKRQLVIPAPGDLAVGLVSVLEGSEMTISLSCQSAGDGVLVQGQVDATLIGQCGRCLGELQQGQSFDFQELYFYPGKGPESEEDGALFLNDGQVDLEPVLREAIVLSLPFNPLCADDCAGLCPLCGTNLNQQPSHNHPEQLDARWQKLQELGSQSGE